MMKLSQQMEKYILKNEKDIYYRINKDLSVENIEPSFVFELIYFNEFDIAEEESKKCVKKKYKKLNRMVNLSTEIIYERLFKNLIHSNRYCFDLANELIIRDKEKFFNLMYGLAYISEDENKLIKTYLFEIMYNDLGYREYLLKNLLDYFTHSCNKYMDITDKKQMEYFYSRVSALYVEIYNKKYKNNLEIPKETKLSKIKNIIYNKLKK